MNLRDLLSKTLHTLKRSSSRAIQSVQLSDWDLGDHLDDIFWDQGPVPGETPYEQAIYLLYRAKNVLICIGSGLSADSGIATFRGADGSIYQDAAGAALTHRDAFFARRAEQLAMHARWRDIIQQAPPNAGHEALVTLASRPNVTLATQNVDGMIERVAHTRAQHVEVLHLHGTLARVRCDACMTRYQGMNYQDFEHLPPCRACGGALRPDVVWFGEELDQEVLGRARRAAQRAEVCMIVGTSALVYPAASLPEIAKQSGARLIEVNIAETVLTPWCDVVIHDGASSALSALVEGLTRLPARR